MDKQHRAQFTALLEAIMTEYGREVGTPTFHLWWNTLERFDYEAVRRALTTWIQNPDSGQFAPKPADVIRMIEGTTGDRALMAWSNVEKAVRIVGHYQSVAFDDPIIHRVIDDMGGWIRLASTDTNKELEFRGKEFVKRYRAFAMVGGTDEYPAYLVGATEATNHNQGYKVENQLRIIGDPEKAALVYQQGGTGPTLKISSVSSLDKLAKHALRAIEAPKGEADNDANQK